MTPPDIVDEVNNETSKHIDFDVVTNSAMYKSVLSVLVDVIETGYAEIQESILENNKLDDMYLPTYHILTKHCPRISHLLIIPLNSHSNDFTILDFE